MPISARPMTRAAWRTVDRRSSAITGRGGASNFDTDERGIEDVADERHSLRDYLGEQLRLSFADPVDRMIGAHLIALLCPAGRLTADPAAIADAMAIPLERVEAVRARMMHFDPVGLFARDLQGVPGGAACRA